MAKQGNPLFKTTMPVDTEVIEVDADIIPLNETFPGEKPMSVREKKRLAELEEIVTTNFKAFYEVGCALREIHQSLLYRESHTNFADYAKDLWDLARSRAYQLIDAADVVDRLIALSSNLSTNGGQMENVHICGHSSTKEVGNVSHGKQDGNSLPQNESQARALAKYPANKQIEIWRQAVETADGRITAAHIKRTARQMHGKGVEETIKKARKKASSPSVKMTNRMRAAFDELFDAVNEERLADWKHTDPNELLRYLQGLMQAIAEPL